MVHTCIGNRKNVKVLLLFMFINFKNCVYNICVEEKQFYCTYWVMILVFHVKLPLVFFHISSCRQLINVYWCKFSNGLKQTSSNVLKQQHLCYVCTRRLFNINPPSSTFEYGVISPHAFSVSEPNMVHETRQRRHIRSRCADSRCTVFEAFDVWNWEMVGEGVSLFIDFIVWLVAGLYGYQCLLVWCRQKVASVNERSLMTSAAQSKLSSSSGTTPTSEGDQLFMLLPELAAAVHSLMLFFLIINSLTGCNGPNWLVTKSLLYVCQCRKQKHVNI